MSSNKNFDNLAAEVIKKYCISPENISFIRSDLAKAFWKVKAKEGTLCLKLLGKTYKKALFSTYAQNHINCKGGNVPRIFRNNSNSLVTQHNNQLFVLSEWIHGKNLNFDNRGDLFSALKGLAKFHIYSKGYIAPQDSEISSRPGRWPEEYELARERLVEWKELSKNISLPYHAAYLKYVDSILEISDTAISLLLRSDYKKLSAQESLPLITNFEHFGGGNILLTEKGVYIIELDSAAPDLPAEDLRRIILQQAGNKNQWSIEGITDMVDCYSDVNPLSAGEKKLLYIHLIFPHRFFSLLRYLFQDNKPVSPAEIERTAALEQSKARLLISSIHP